jgi:hypothetical protein
LGFGVWGLGFRVESEGFKIRGIVVFGIFVDSAYLETGLSECPEVGHTLNPDQALNL